LAKNSCTSTLVGHRDYVLSAAFSTDGKWILSGSKDRSVQFWDPNSGVLHLMLQGHKNSVISVSVNSKMNMFATGSGDNKTRIWKFSNNSSNNISNGNISSTNNMNQLQGVYKN
jgi:general transcriptional corepressor TUP1